MKVNFFATLRDIAGGKTVEFDVAEGITAQELLNTITERFPVMKKEWLDQDGRMYGHVHLFINGRDVQFLDDGELRMALIEEGKTLSGWGREQAVRFLKERREEKGGE